jgi:hypothetical protein
MHEDLVEAKRIVEKVVNVMPYEFSDYHEGYIANEILGALYRISEALERIEEYNKNK